MNKLIKFDNKWVRIVDITNTIYEGLGIFYDKEYNYHEYGRCEDSINISYFIFYESDIKKIKVIDEQLNTYGKIEEETLNDGINLIEQVLTSDYDEDVIRLLHCLNDKITDLDNKDEIIILLKDLLKYNENKEIIKLTKKILEKYL